MGRLRRTRMLTGTALLMLAAGVGTGCQNKLHDDNLALHRQNREQQDRIRQLEGERDQRPDPSQVSALQQDVASKEARIRELEEQLRQPPPNQPADPALAGVETSYNQATGELTVNLPGDVLFDSGKATLKQSSKATLDKVIRVIRKDYPDKKVTVLGHTDSDPISKTRDQWKDNLDLSAARARAVEQYLGSNGVDSKMIGTQAFGPTRPRGNKAGSRRVEIVVATR